MSVSSQKGFTLIELLVVLAIMVVLSGIAFFGGRSGEQTLALDRAAHEVAQNIRKAGALTLRAEPYEGCDLSGYGAHFSIAKTGSYDTFADCNRNMRYDSADQVVGTMRLPDGIRMKALSPTPSFSITFAPPDPAIEIRRTTMPFGSPRASGYVILEVINDPLKTKQITMYATGAIDID